MATDTKEDLLFKAKLCEEAKCFDAMVETVKKLINMDADLSSEERKMVAAAFKGMASSRRASWHAVNGVERDANSDLSEQQKQVTEEYRAKMEGELVDIYQEALECINEVLLPNASDAEAKVFYLKMKGDYYRYMAELAPDEDRVAVVELSQAAYQSGLDIATAELAPANPTRLGLTLNYCVFHSNVMQSKESAYQLAQKALDEVSAEANVTEETKKTMQLIRDNMDAWKPKDVGAMSAQ